MIILNYDAFTRKGMEDSIPLKDYLAELRKNYDPQPDGAEPREIEIRIQNTEERPCCMNCGEPMVKNGYAKRTVRDKEKFILKKVQQYICKHCRSIRQDKSNDERPQYNHRALPDGLLPYKHTSAEVIFTSGLLGEEETRDPRDEAALEKAQRAWDELRMFSDERTQNNWKTWFHKFRIWASGTLRQFWHRTKHGKLKDAADRLDTDFGTIGQLGEAVRIILFFRGHLSN